ncbi:MAG TPA: DUF58 domain-containing protein [Candidatus Woesearchaeota archaeon]|nr:DUF58 domain-containing protein [Candidatus Woesearchaeota archaeon]
MLTELNVNLRPLVKKLEVLSKKNVGGELAGGYRTFFKGRGLDFDGYRKYESMDDSNQIDWKASLRAQDLLLKVFLEERNLDVFILFDTSASMCFSSTEKLKCEYAAEVVASIAFASIQVGDNVGLIMFNDTVKAMIKPKQGKAQFGKIIHTLSNPKHYDGQFNLEAAITVVNSVMKREGIVMIVSDFIGLPDNWRTLLAGLTSKCDLFAIMIRDPRDDDLPLELQDVSVSDPYSEETLLFNTREFKDRFSNNAREIKEKIIHNVKVLRGNFLELNTTEPFEKKIISFFRMAI